MYQIDPERDDLVAEFLRRPFGHHSAELQRLLNVLRGGPVKDRYVLVCTKPHREWVLGQLSGVRGEPPRIFDDRVYTSAEDAERAVFKLRWEQRTGRKIDAS
ncbi:MAG: hypothetical protein R3322_09775 [Kiloniellales bacterium]|jgi:hypothetical protein|nr:hypothetical protein [Kiloniellales bacterium]